MSDRNLDQLLDAWMDLGPTTAPNRVADAVRLEARTMRQTAIPAWWPPRRSPSMNTYVRIGAVAAVLVIAAALGYNYLIAPNVGAPGLDDLLPTPTPTPESFDGQPEGVEMPIGTYVMTEVDGFRITFTVPDGWQNVTTPGLIWGDGARMGFWRVDNLYADVCPDDLTPEPRDPPIGPSVDDLVSAFADVTPGFSGVVVRELTDVTVDGFAGKRMELRFGANESCIGTAPVLWPINGGEPKPAPPPGSGVEHFWILDVAGERLVITQLITREASNEVRVELQEILDSVDIEPA